MSDYLESTYDKFIFKVRTGYLYSPADFWARIDNGAATIGVTDFLQKSKGDVAFLETVDVGSTVTRGQELGKIETIKATFDIISPVTGKIIAVNPEIDASSYLINHDPYGAGWLYKMELTDLENDKTALLSDSAYLKVMEEKIAQEAKKLYG